MGTPRCSDLFVPASSSSATSFSVAAELKCMKGKRLFAIDEDCDDTDNETRAFPFSRNEYQYEEGSPDFMKENLDSCHNNNNNNNLRRSSRNHHSRNSYANRRLVSKTNANYNRI